jgi:N-methylhydantoinase A/oxoprolinase/acetone carboxylase beta subunit
LDESTQTLRLEKVETSPRDPAVGVLQGFHKANAKLGSIGYFVHGTTLGLNALLTRRGAKIAIVTTKGFRDGYVSFAGARQAYGVAIHPETMEINFPATGALRRQR